MRPVKRVVLPADLTDAKNGQLRPNLLRAIKPLGQLHHLAADAYGALRAAALADGIRPFKPTARPDTYRSYAEQAALFNARYTTTPIPGQPTKVWEGRRYWQKPGTAVAAVPGFCHHRRPSHTLNGRPSSGVVVYREVKSATCSWYERYVSGRAVGLNGRIPSAKAAARSAP